MGVRRRPPHAGRERFLQSRLSAKGARRRPRERSSAGASGGLLPAGNGKADAVWSSTRQTATTSHNFILESRPAAAPARAGERTGGGALGGEAQGAASPRVPGPRSKLVTALLRDGCSPALPWASRALLPSPQLTPRPGGVPGAARSQPPTYYRPSLLPADPRGQSFLPGRCPGRYQHDGTTISGQHDETRTDVPTAPFPQGTRGQPSPCVLRPVRGPPTFPQLPEVPGTNLRAKQAVSVSFYE